MWGRGGSLVVELSLLQKAGLVTALVTGPFSFLVDGRRRRLQQPQMLWGKHCGGWEVVLQQSMVGPAKALSCDITVIVRLPS